MKTINTLEAIFIALISIIYAPFLNKCKLKLIKEDFKRYAEWAHHSYSLFSFYICFAENRGFRSVVYRRLGKARFLTNGFIRGMGNLYICTEDIGGA